MDTDLPELDIPYLSRLKTTIKATTAFKNMNTEKRNTIDMKLDLQRVQLA